MLILSPPNGFLSRSLFHTLPSLRRNVRFGLFPRFQRQDFFQPRSAEHRENVQRCTVTQRGMGKKESGGLGEKTQKGKGDKHANAPPFPRVVSPSIGKPALRKNSTQII